MKLACNLLLENILLQNQTCTGNYKADRFFGDWLAKFIISFSFPRIVQHEN